MSTSIEKFSPATYDYLKEVFNYTNLGSTHTKKRKINLQYD